MFGKLLNLKIWDYVSDLGQTELRFGDDMRIVIGDCDRDQKSICMQDWDLVLRFD